MELNEVDQYLKHLETLFDHVRLIDYPNLSELTLEDNEFKVSEYHCYEYWLRGKRCTNCISARAYNTKEKVTKFEFIDECAYLVVANYLEIDGKGCVIECITKLNDVQLFHENEEIFREKMNQYYDETYLNYATHLPNKRYYDDQVANIEYSGGILLKTDYLNKNAISEIIKRIHKTDIFVQLKIDEYLLLFHKTDSTRVRYLTIEIKAILVNEAIVHKLASIYEKNKAQTLLEKLRQAISDS